MTRKIDFKDNQTILFIGDSITDAQRLETPYHPLGQGYVYFAANFLVAQYPELNLTIENRGISANTTRALKSRWQTDCLDLKPDIVSVLVGINDLWRQFAPAQEMQRTHVPADEYEANLRWMLREVVENCDSRIVLMEPCYFMTTQDDPMLNGLPAYIDAIHRLCDEFEAVLVPLQAEYEKIKNKVAPEKWTWDGVHPYTWAHAWIARQWLLAVC